MTSAAALTVSSGAIDGLNHGVRGGDWFQAAFAHQRAHVKKLNAKPNTALLRREPGAEHLVPGRHLWAEPRPRSGSPEELRLLN